MTTILAAINWELLLKVVWTTVCIPLLIILKGKIDEWAKAHKTEKYTNMLFASAEHVVKQIQDDIVKEIKGTDAWTEERIKEISEMAIDKTIEGLTNEAYSYLAMANEDLYSYIDTIIKSKLYDLKYKEKQLND